MLNCSHKPLDGVCKLCGILTYSNSTLAYKHTQFKSHHKAKCLFEDLSSVSCTYQSREELIDFLYHSVITLHLTDQTFHLAVHFMDRCQQLMETNNQKLVALLCLMASAKMIEDDSHIPGMLKLSQASDLNLQLEQYKHTEYLVLKQLNWKLKINTLYQQVQSLLCLGVFFSTDQIEGTLDQNMINFVCSKMLKDYSRIVYQVIKISQLMLINTKILAMAIVLYMRKLCNLHPLYPYQLQSFIDEDSNQLLIDTYGQLNNLLNANTLNATKSVSRAVSPACLQTCKSLPPMNRALGHNVRTPLNVITNHQSGIKPKLIKSKHQEHELNPLRVKHRIN